MTLVELEALAGIKDLSLVLGVNETTLSSWVSRRRDNGFPEEIWRLSNGPVFDKREVVRWWFNYKPTRDIPKPGNPLKEELEYAGIEA